MIPRIEEAVKSAYENLTKYSNLCIISKTNVLNEHPQTRDGVLVKNPFA
jgi:hypothetical protein